MPVSTARMNLDRRPKISAGLAKPEPFSPPSAMTKVCRKCKVEHGRDNFYPNPGCRDGLGSYCRQCHNALNTDWKRRNKERINRQRREKYKPLPPEKAMVLYHIQMKRYPEKVNARHALQWAVRNGSVKKPTRCQSCTLVVPRRGLHGHHADYSKPLDVKWLCPPCHAEEHLRMEGE
ncbi:hypothetical protein LCGC14_2401170 [marine sediment metagenome]|uniref:Uncharacterized protein n=1 Tax=marine sediment metagenome TaxID=412755 RepID=A0A0F9CHF1_9ZZZZ